MTTEERLDRLVNIVDSLAASVIHHDDQIEAHDRQLDALIRIAEKHAESTAKV
jgi:DNA replicative helicase MCM subunit Mcm2 (Cdc46/Mcm family)